MLRMSPTFSGFDCTPLMMASRIKDADPLPCDHPISMKPRWEAEFDGSGNPTSPGQLPFFCWPGGGHRSVYCSPTVKPKFGSLGLCAYGEYGSKPVENAVDLRNWPEAALAVMDWLPPMVHNMLKGAVLANAGRNYRVTLPLATTWTYLIPCGFAGFDT